jgi:ubiquinone/menaquinone biosynthesis C-methylase UbiE
MGGPVLELGVCAGRIAIPLAQAGFQVTGLDISWPMLARGREHIRAAGLQTHIHLIHADFRTPPLAPGRFPLAFCAYNAFLHLIEGEDQLMALRAWRRLLTPGGLLVIDVENPQLEGLAMLMLQQGFDPEETLTDPETGERIHKSTRVDVDLSDQVLRFQRRYEGEDASGPWQITQDFEVRILFQRELALLLTCAGYVDIRFYGDFDLNPWEPDSPRTIAVAAAS